MYVVRAWVRDSWKQYDFLAHSSDADVAGVQITSGAVFQNTFSTVHIALFFQKENAKIILCCHSQTMKLNSCEF